MMRIGKRTLNEKWLGLIRARIGFQVIDRALRDKGGWVKLFRHSRAPSLRRNVIVSGKLVFCSAQRVGMQMTCFEPSVIVSDGLITVPDSQFHMVKTVIGNGRLKFRISLPGRWKFLIVAARFVERLIGFTQILWWLGPV